MKATHAYLKLGLLGMISVLHIAVVSANTRSDYSQLEREIAASEAQYLDIVPGTEKSIRWYREKTKRPYAIVYIHGFSASAKELSPIPEKLADQLGANIYFARLTGHGRSADAMAEASVEAWKEDALEALRIGQQLGDKLILISTSTGATLATWLAAQTVARDIHANILVSPNFGIANKLGEIVRWPLGFKLAKWLTGSYREFTPLNEVHKQYWTERYPIEAVVPMIHLVDEVVEMDKQPITSPHLLLFSPHDKVISTSRIYQVAEQLTRADVTLRPFALSDDPYQHVLGGDACSPASTEAIVKIMYRYALSLSSL